MPYNDGDKLDGIGRMDIAVWYIYGRYLVDIPDAGRVEYAAHIKGRPLSFGRQNYT